MSWTRKSSSGGTERFRNRLDLGKSSLTWNIVVETSRQSRPKTKTGTREGRYSEDGSWTFEKWKARSNWSERCIDRRNQGLGLKSWNKILIVAQPNWSIESVE